MIHQILKYHLPSRWICANKGAATVDEVWSSLIHLTVDDEKLCGKEKSERAAQYGITHLREARTLLATHVDGHKLRICSEAGVLQKPERLLANPIARTQQRRLLVQRFTVVADQDAWNEKDTPVNPRGRRAIPGRETSSGVCRPKAAVRE